MGHKKYYGYKPTYERYSVALYEKEGTVGEFIVFVYEDGKCRMDHCFWGSELDYERNRDGEVEHTYSWDEENTQKLMLRTGTKNGKALVKAMYDRFHTHESGADCQIRKWCDSKEINYQINVWY